VHLSSGKVAHISSLSCFSSRTEDSIDIPMTPSFTISDVHFRPRCTISGFADYQKRQTLQTALYGEVFLYRDTRGEHIVIKKMANDRSSSVAAESQDLNTAAHAYGIVENLVDRMVSEDPLTEIAAGVYLRKLHEESQYVLRITCYWQDDRYTYLASPFCSGGGLFEKVAALGGLSAETVQQIMWQLLEAVNFLHSKNLAHRDVSLENILFADESCERIQLMDFGAACACTHPDGTIIHYTDNHVGKVTYRPPEMYTRRVQNVKVQPSYTAPMFDAFACGVAMYYMFTASSLWTRAQLPDKIFAFIQQHSFAALLTTRSFARFNEKIDEIAKRVLSGLLNFDCDRRFSIEQAMGHEWFGGFSDVENVVVTFSS